MTARFIGLVSFLFGAEVAASWWVWGGAPTDSIGVWYSGFWVFEADRLHYWGLLFAPLLLLWVVLSRSLLRHSRPIVWWVCAAALGIGLELTSSVLYWRSPRSSDLRGLYQSLWMVNRFPQASNIESTGFRVYLGEHLVAWAIFLIVAMTLFVFFEKKWRKTTSRLG